MSALDKNQTGVPADRKFRLGRADAKMMGVCSGMADYFGVDVMLVRMGWILGTILGFGSLILIYLAIGLIAE